MKKFLITLVLFFLTPLLVSAADYKITDFLIKSNILSNGDLEINELIVLDGSFNGYERDIVYTNSSLNGNDFSNNPIYNGTSLDNVEIKAKYVKNVSMATFNDLDFEPFSKTANASLGSKGLYIASPLQNGKRYRMYYKASSEKVAFNIKYTVKNAAVLHNDVAELYWTFIPDGFEDKINNIEIELYLPKTDTSSDFRLWAHGNLSGNISKINNNGVKATISEVNPKESVDIRLTFAKSLLVDNENLKKSNTDALEKIIEVETERAEVANNLRAKLLRTYNFVKYSTLILYLIIIISIVYIYYKYGKSPKSEYYSKYNREFIDDYNVEVIDYLMNRKITSNAMSASIMNLIYKKNISAEEMPSTKKKKDYIFTLENTENLNESENILIEFLFDRVGKKALNSENKKTFSTIDLKKYASGTKTCNKFITSYTNWRNNVLELGKKEHFYEANTIPKLIGTIILIISIIILIIALINGVDYIPTYFLIIASSLCFIYSILVIKKTEKGALHYDKWQAFKNFLNDFGAFNLKELPEIVLWERYLVYATIFGLADKVQKSMNVHIKEIETSDYQYDYYPSFVYINIGNTINTSINNAINSAYSTQAANFANSHSSSSSGSGFGGGFSSGGGFGGGGGGGRGF